MTPSRPRRPPFRRSLAVAATLLGLAACTRHDAGRAPEAEFIMVAGDSAYWVRNDGRGVKVRGSPLVLARVEGRFVELYVVDEDRSFENALFVGQRLYQRDLITGDSAEIFRDTVVPRLAERYQRRNPDARRLAPDEDPGEEPTVSASAEVSVLSVNGPFLSLEYHVDTAGADDDGWHMTRHAVVDLRTSRLVSLADILGPEESASAVARGRAIYRETLDSTSFSLVAPNGTLMIAFSAPGQGSGGEGFTMPMRPLAVREPAWWTDARDALPTSTREREELWTTGAYSVKAAYDSTDRPVAIALVDSGGREYPVEDVSPPVHRIYWLDRPPIDKVQRNALTRAFDEAAMYDASARSARGPAPRGPTLAYAP
jgi:hypothetical protein